MVTLDEAFEAWLDEKLYSMDASRREWAHIIGVSLSDLKWAFSAGWTNGQLQLLEEQEVLLQINAKRLKGRT